MDDQDDILGSCEWCGELVVYRRGMSGDDPEYPLWGFDEVAGEDFVYHQKHEADGLPPPG